VLKKAGRAPGAQAVGCISFYSVMALYEGNYRLLQFIFESPQGILVESPWQKKQWCIGVIDGGFLAGMENVLELYEQPVKAGRVRLCLDERPCQLLKDVYPPLPMKKGKPIRQDYDRPPGDMKEQVVVWFL
jgi:hypothetical protein